MTRYELLKYLEEKDFLEQNSTTGVFKISNREFLKITYSYDEILYWKQNILGSYKRLTLEEFITELRGLKIKNFILFNLDLFL